MSSIRTASIEDIQGLLDCIAAVWESLRDTVPKQWVEDEIEGVRQPDAKNRLGRVIANPTRVTLVAEEEGEIVGIAFGRIQKGGLSWLNFMGGQPSPQEKGHRQKAAPEVSRRV